MKRRPANFIKTLIWVYFLLLIFEGALRKWILPGLSDILLIIRDPVVLLIYVIALQENRFPRNGKVMGAILLGIPTLAIALALTGSPVVSVYGFRINYLQIPLIYLIPRYFNLRDVLVMGRFTILLSIPMSLLIMLQFSAPNDSWINASPGGTLGEGIMGAKGKFRPPGTFPFITGVASFYPLVVAFLLASVFKYRLVNTPILLIASGLAVIAAFASISRLNVLSCLLVLAAGAACLPFMKQVSNKVVRIVIIGALLAAILPFLEIYDESTAAFTERWESATDMPDDEAKEMAILQRFLFNFTSAYYALIEAPLLGKGLGVGSNVGARYLTGEVTFLLGETEWQKILMELGPLFGIGFIVLRLMIFRDLVLVSMRSLRKGEPVPLLIFSATGLLILVGQWGPPTLQGFAILGAGLTLAASIPPPTSAAATNPTHSKTKKLNNPPT